MKEKTIKKKFSFPELVAAIVIITNAWRDFYKVEVDTKTLAYLSTAIIGYLIGSLDKNGIEVSEIEVN